MLFPKGSGNVCNADGSCKDHCWSPKTDGHDKGLWQLNNAVTSIVKHCNKVCDRSFQVKHGDRHKSRQNFHVQASQSVLDATQYVQFRDVKLDIPRFLDRNLHSPTKIQVSIVYMFLCA